MNSFDNYTAILSRWTSVNVGAFASNTIGAFGRHSSNGYRASNTSGGASGRVAHINKTYTPSGVGFVIGFSYKSSNPIGGPNLFCSINDTGVVQVGVVLNPAGTLSLVRGSTIIATSVLGLTTGVQYYIEFDGTIDPAAGALSVRVNGALTPWVTFSGNTRNTANTVWNGLSLGLMINNLIVSDGVHDFDDLYVLDKSGSAPWNAFLGDVRVDVRNPTAAGATTGFTPSAGSNFQNVDDVAPNDDTDFNSAAAAPATDTFVFQDVPVAGAIIYGIQHCIYLRKTDAGICTVAPVVRHSGVDNVGANITPGTSYAFGLALNPTNPGTGLQWTEAGFNAAEFGYQRTT
jgi:hypothetical protein